MGKSIFKSLLLLTSSIFIFSCQAFAKDPLPTGIVPYNSGISAHYFGTSTIPAYTTNIFSQTDAAQFSLVRLYPDWQTIEKTKGVYDFTYADWLIGQFQARGMRPVIGLGLNNPLYGVSTRIRTEEQRQAFGNFVRAITHRYRGKHVIWEVWNEPNIPHFWRKLPGETLTSKQAVPEYLAMLDVVAPIVREEDPEALLIGPGAANYNTPWLFEALRLGLMTRLDGLSVHPYQPNSGRPELVIAQHNQVKSWIPSASDRNKPVFFTEWGYSTGNGTYDVTPEVQSNFLQRQYLLSMMLGVTANFTYSLTDAGVGEPCVASNKCYGLFTRYTGKPKSGLIAMKSIHKKLAGYHFVNRIGYSIPTVYILKFVNSKSQTKYIAWDSQTKKPVPVKLPDGHKIQVTQAPLFIDDLRNK